jgi:hypothetical protein
MIIRNRSLSVFVPGETAIRGEVYELEMQIKKTYQNINPELLYDEIRDFTLKHQEVIVEEKKLETYSLPDDTSSFISRGTLTFRTNDEKKECLRVHIVGSAKAETRVIFDIDEKLFPKQKIEALQNDLNFIFKSYEVKNR